MAHLWFIDAIFFNSCKLQQTHGVTDSSSLFWGGLGLLGSCFINTERPVLGFDFSENSNG
jgi:hypothetical protein